MDKNLFKKIQQYRTDGRNLFSYTEKITAAMACPDLYRELMPEQYQDNPLEAFFQVLDTGQRLSLRDHFTPGHVNHDLEKARPLSPDGSGL